MLLPRDNIPDKKDTVVCERHWPPGYPTIVHYGKERPRDPPSVSNCVKKGLIPSQPPPLRTTAKTAAETRNSYPDELKSIQWRRYYQ